MKYSILLIGFCLLIISPFLSDSTMHYDNIGLIVILFGIIILIINLIRSKEQQPVSQLTQKPLSKVVVAIFSILTYIPILLRISSGFIMAGSFKYSVLSIFGFENLALLIVPGLILFWIVKSYNNLKKISLIFSIIFLALYFCQFGNTSLNLIKYLHINDSRDCYDCDWPGALLDNQTRF